MNARDFEALIGSLEAQGYKRTEIAHRAGVSRWTVWRMATGQMRTPLYDTVERIKSLDTTTATAVRPVHPRKG